MKRLTTYQLTEVTWHDASSFEHHSAWGGLEKFITEIEDGLCTCRTVGYVVHETKTTLALAASLTLPNGIDEAPGEVSGTMIIPKNCIVERRRL